MKRRSFIKAGLLGVAGGTLAAPAIVSAQQRSFNWKMTNAYGRLALLCSGPRQPRRTSATWCGPCLAVVSPFSIAAGELIPALEGFDAVSKGIVEMNTANSFFWAGKTFAAQYFHCGSVRLNFQGFNSWIYHGGGQQLWEEVYAPFNLVPMIIGNTGVQMTGWFRKPIEKIDDLKASRCAFPASLACDVAAWR